MGGNLSLSEYSLHRTSGQFIETDKETDENVVHGKSTNDQY